MISKDLESTQSQQGLKCEGCKWWSVYGKSEINGKQAGLCDCPKNKIIISAFDFRCKDIK